MSKKRALGFLYLRTAAGLHKHRLPSNSTGSNPLAARIAEVHIALSRSDQGAIVPTTWSVCQRHLHSHQVWLCSRTAPLPVTFIVLDGAQMEGVLSARRRDLTAWQSL